MPESTDAGRRVVAAARELFAERGYAGTTTRAIAQRAGVNEVTIFRRFQNKAGILAAIAAQFAEGAAGTAARAAMGAGAEDAAAAEATDGERTAAGTRDRLRELAGLEIRAALENGGLALRLAFEARSVPEVAEVLGAGTSENVSGLVAFLGSCQRAGTVRPDLPPHLLAEAFFALTSNLVMARQLTGSAPPPQDAAVEALVTHLVDIFWSGASAHATSRTNT